MRRSILLAQNNNMKVVSQRKLRSIEKGNSTFGELKNSNIKKPLDEEILKISTNEIEFNNH
jgi:hypothetical protein